MKIKVIENQSALDLVTQNLGKLEASFDFCFINEISLTDEINSGQVLEIPNSLNSDENVSGYFSAKKTKLTTSYPLKEIPFDYGIGTMKIGLTFKVN